MDTLAGRDLRSPAENMEVKWEECWEKEDYGITNSGHIISLVNPCFCCREKVLAVFTKALSCSLIEFEYALRKQTCFKGKMFGMLNVIALDRV